MRFLKAVLFVGFILALTACSSSTSDSAVYTFDVNGVAGRLSFEGLSPASTQVTLSFAGGRFANAPARIRRSGAGDVALASLDGNGRSVTTANVAFAALSTSGTLVVGNPADPDFSLAYPPAP